MFQFVYEHNKAIYPIILDYLFLNCTAINVTNFTFSFFLHNGRESCLTMNYQTTIV